MNPYPASHVYYAMDLFLKILKAAVQKEIVLQYGAVACIGGGWVGGSDHVQGAFGRGS